MLVRHDAKLKVVTTCGIFIHGNPCSNDIIEAKYLDERLSIIAFMHGKVSGYG